MADKYSDFEQLTKGETEGVDFRVVSRAKRSAVVIVAPHGGGIEPGTSEIGDAIAGDDLSFYAFEGIKRRHNGTLHITSSRFDEPRCMKLVEMATRAISVHGESSVKLVVFLGGRDTATIERLRVSLQRRGFDVMPHQNPQLQGRDPHNICNRCASGAGVQLELSAGLRRAFFKSLSADGRKKTQRFRDFVAAVREGIGKGV